MGSFAAVMRPTHQHLIHVTGWCLQKRAVGFCGHFALQHLRHKSGCHVLTESDLPSKLTKAGYSMQAVTLMPVGRACYLPRI